jgi:hypothetical protein
VDPGLGLIGPVLAPGVGTKQIPKPVNGYESPPTGQTQQPIQTVPYTGQPSTGGDGVQTNYANPPPWSAPGIYGATEAATNQFNRGGTPVAPFSDATNQALQMAQQRATSGSAVSNAANDYATKTLNGGFMGSNPYLDQTFNRAALATQNQLASQFGASGRDPGESQFLRSEQLGNLANTIYGGQYQNERQNQQAIAGLAPGLANQSWSDIGGLANAGTTIDQRNQQVAGQPQQALQDYINQLNSVSGGYGQQQQYLPSQTNTASGVLGGALLGSQLAGNQYRGWGAGIGGLLGYLGGG